MKPLSPKYKAILAEAIGVLQEVVETGIGVEKQMPIKETYDGFLAIQVNMFSRFIHRIESIIILIEHFDKNPTVEDPIGLIIRSSLTDFISKLYIDVVHYKAVETKDYDELNRIVKAYLGDHLRSLIGLFKDYYKTKELDEDKYIKSLQNLKRKFPDFFKDEPLDINNPKQNLDIGDFPKNRQLVEVIHQHPEYTKQQIKSVYSMFAFYSKYEHFGILTNEMQTMDSDVLLYRMLKSIRYMITGALLSLMYIQVEHFISHKLSITGNKELLSLLQQYDVILKKLNSNII